MLAQTIGDVPTPAAVVLENRMESNLRRFQAIADESGCRLRPHIKTHRTVALAARQLEFGASGLAVAKLNEAEALVEAGLATDICVAYPLVGRDKLRRYADLTDQVDRLSTVVDSWPQARALTDHIRPVRVLLWVDTGLGRCGFAWDSQEAVREAARVAALPGIEVLGVGTHGGFSYAGQPKRAMELERDRLLTFTEGLQKLGIPVPEVSLGSTPTVRFFRNTNTGRRRVTELRPGNYIFMDWTQVRLGVAEVADCSLVVLTTVVSVRRDGVAILDAGSKFLSSDTGAHGGDGASKTRHGVLLTEDFRAVRLESGLFRLSEEHGFLRTGGRSVSVGDRLAILPAHACAVAHLAGTLHLADEHTGRILASLPVMPRGSL